MYMGGEGHGEIKDQAGKFVPLSNCDIDATKEDQFYAELLQIAFFLISPLLRSISMIG